MPTAPRRRRRGSRRWGSFPTTADMGIWAHGGTPERLFEALGLGLHALTVDLRSVRAQESRTVEATGPDLSSLVVAYLGQLLLLEQDGFLLRDIVVHLDGHPPCALRAEAWGEPYDPARQRRRTEVKAITLHRLSVDLARGRARVIVDI